MILDLVDPAHQMVAGLPVSPGNPFGPLTPVGPYARFKPLRTDQQWNPSRTIQVTDSFGNDATRLRCARLNIHRPPA